MKRLIFAVLISMISLSSFCNEIVMDIANLEYRNNIVYEKGSEVPFTGKVVSYYDNGNLKFERTYKDGINCGKSLRYNESGVIEFMVTYEEENSPYYGDIQINEIYDDEGRIMHTYEGFMFGEEADDAEYESYSVCVLGKNLVNRHDVYYKENLEEGNVDPQTPYTGYVISFHDNGQLHERYYLNNGKPDGKYKQFNNLGNLEVEAEFKNGLIDGDVIRYYGPSEIVKEKSHYKNGKIQLESHYYE